MILCPESVNEMTEFIYKFPFLLLLNLCIVTTDFIRILQITKELSRLQQLASENKLSPGDISGGTITLSNIGAIGGKYGSPLLNLPEVSIIALGRIQKVPQFADDGNIFPASVMTVSIHLLFFSFSLFFSFQLVSS